ncbi:MAG: patatin-like phospholipase family protein [Deltaproteobacteria bacterium]|nr:patatin-like phospholipase family protein [Deltaproteobacteria bacterium]
MPIVLFVTGIEEAHTVAGHLSREGNGRWLPSGEFEVVRGDGEHAVAYRFRFPSTAAEAVAELSRAVADLIVVDNRTDAAHAYRSFAATPAGKLLPVLSGARIGTRTVSRRQIALLLSTGDTLARDVYVAGAMKLGGYVVDPFAERTASGKPNPPFLDQIALMLGTRRPGKISLCLAGGGIEGLIYELGVLKAIDEFLVGRKIVDFDVFCGISAGAVIAAFLANGVPLGEVIAGFRDGTADIDPINRAILFTPNTGEIARRLWALGGRALNVAAGAVWRRTPDPAARERAEEGGGRGGRSADLLAAVMRVVPGGFFTGDRLRWYLEEQLTRGGRTNCFHQLKKELYLGATDQDSGRPVVFGEAGFRDVPISHAVRASTALVPYYPPEPIGGRYLVDGAFTRTTNFGTAIRHGARLVFVVNPFVPLLSSRPGAVDAEGGAFAGLQGIKSLVHSRFEQAFTHIDEVYPDVDFQVFIPEGEELEQLTGTLMKLFYRLEIADLAYEHTCARLRRQMPALAEQLRRHGLLLRDPQADQPLDLSGAAPETAPRVPDVAASAS